MSDSNDVAEVPVTVPLPPALWFVLATAAAVGETTIADVILVRLGAERLHRSLRSPRRGRPRDTDLDDLVRRFHEHRMTDEQIGAAVGRAKTTIAGRRQALGLPANKARRTAA